MTYNSTQFLVANWDILVIIMSSNQWVLTITKLQWRYGKKWWSSLDFPLFFAARTSTNTYFATKHLWFFSTSMHLSTNTFSTLKKLGFFQSPCKYRQTLFPHKKALYFFNLERSWKILFNFEIWTLKSVHWQFTAVKSICWLFSSQWKGSVDNMLIASCLKC